MKASRFLLLTALGLVSLGFTGQDAITLQRTLPENTTETYKVDSKVNQTIDSQMTGEIPMTVTSAMTYKVKTGKVDPAKGTLDVEVTMNIDKMDADGPLGGQLAEQKIKPVVEKGTLDKFGHLSLTPAVASNDAMQLAMSGAQTTQATMFIEFPDHPVKVGDTWDIAIPKSPFTGSEDQAIHAKLIGDKTDEGKSVWVVDISGKIHMEIDTSKMPVTGDQTASPLANLKILFKGTVGVTGEGEVEKSTGRTLKLTSNGNLKSTMELPDRDMSFEADGTIASTLTYQN